MRTFVIATFLLTVAIMSVGQQNKSQPSQQKKEATNDAANPKPTTAPAEIHESAPVGATTPQTQKQTTQAESKPFLTHGEWVISILTAIYILISAFGLAAIKRQGNIAEKAAIAAEKSTEALMRIERPWLLITSVNYQVWPEKTPTGILENRSHVHVSIKNSGNSPAWIINQGGRFKAFIKSNDLPQEPDYGTAEQIESYGFVITPGEERAILDIPHESKALANNEFSQVIQGELVWFAYGFFQYKDIFDRIHETRFCWSASGKGVCHFYPHQAPSKYNQYT